jgi:hypothetical protein
MPEQIRLRERREVTGEHADDIMRLLTVLYEEGYLATPDEARRLWSCIRRAWRRAGCGSTRTMRPTPRACGRISPTRTPSSTQDAREGPGPHLGVGWGLLVALTSISRGCRLFYCDSCQKKNGWPEGYSHSRGACEVCGEQAMCHDVPSSALPRPPGWRASAAAALLTTAPPASPPVRFHLLVPEDVDAAVAKLRELEEHHVNLSGRMGRPQTWNTTLRLVRETLVLLGEEVQGG